MLVEPETITRAQSGDDEAFSEIIRTYRKRILGTVYRMISRGDDVEDVGQEVFVRLYDSIGQLRTPQVFEPWLYRLTVNACYDYLRRKRREVDIRMADLSEEQIVAIDAALSGRRAIEDSHKEGAKELLEAVLGRVSEEDRLPARAQGDRGLVPQGTEQGLQGQHQRSQGAPISRSQAGIEGVRKDCRGSQPTIDAVGGRQP